MGKSLSVLLSDLFMLIYKVINVIIKCILVCLHGTKVGAVHTLYEISEELVSVFLMTMY